MPVPVARVALLLFGSGLCALVYQVAWLRELRLIFGASTAASAAVLAVFMGGLGAGGLVLGRRVEAKTRPLAFYAQLEFLIALSSAATPIAVWLARAAYVAVGGTQALGLGFGTVARLVLAGLVLSVPTFLMGGTLPAAARAVETEGDIGRRRLAILYGVNTLGAVAGTLLSTFALLEILGTRRMLWSACALNALVAMAARALARKLPERAAPSRPVEKSLARAPSRVILAAAALVGFAFLLMELVWYRMLGPLLGGSSFTFGLILATALFGIGLGGAAYALFGGARRPTLYGLALTLGAEAALIALPYALGDRIAIWTALLRPLGSIGFAGLLAGWAAICAVVVLPAAFLAGVQFPLLIALLGAGDDEVGSQVGLAYAWNTGGAILGSLAGGFGALPILTAPGAWRLVVVMLAALAVWSLAAARRERAPERRGGWMLALALAALAVALLSARGPTAAWRHGAVGAGRAPTSGTPNTLAEWAASLRREIIWEAEGVESSVAINNAAGYAFVVNGKVDGNARNDAPTQVMSGLIGALLHPAAKKSMVIGLGTGSTAGWLGAVPTMERVDVAELEPAILHVADLCRPVNRDALSNPKIHVLIGDARELLLVGRERYDVIFSEPSNPYRAGISSLFTQDFYRAGAARLENGGLFLQWVQAYSVDAETVRSAYATVASVFPYVETWVTEEADLVLVASLQPIRYDVQQLRARIAEEPWASALAGVWRVGDLEGVLAHFAAQGSLARAIAIADADNVSTDDQTLIEYGFARGVGRRASLFRTAELRKTARERGEDRPALVENGAIDWALVDDRRISMLAAQETPPEGLPYRYPPASIARGQAFASWLDGDFAEALEHARADPRLAADAARDPMLRVLLAESLADGGDERALDEASRLPPIEADLVIARLRLKQNRLAEATDALERAFTGYRKDPWPLPALIARALKLPAEIAQRDRALGERLYHALKIPFAVSLFDEQRQNAVVQLAVRVDFPRLCREALAPREPNPLWKHDALLGRLDCYERTGDPRAAGARRDVERFAAEEPLPFASGLK
ncbi:MAG TPA: fused MFS/spermidine synthase [Polyangia bacterium]|nr:fused MFS/spermidine synthase [Polyangia bacterium]